MRYEIFFAPQALSQYKRLPAETRARVRDALEVHLRHDPGKTSRSRIKRLRGIKRPAYRLRVDDFRIYYDVSKSDVEILAVLSKAEALAWLEREGVS